jgi:primosomal protein N' (replication factor Y)
VIVLIPEIALTPQTFSVFSARYERIALIHSGFSAAERFDAYTRIRNGEVDVVIGTRSAVFAPVPDLGAIIIDEEHEHTYKSEMSPRYHARDIAKFRCASKNALLLMASATPDVESYKNALDGRYALVRLGERYGNAVLPEVRVVQTLHGGSPDIMGPDLVHEVRERLRRNEQAILFINRRGFNQFFVCHDCGEVVRCPNCDVSMTYHVKDRDYSSGFLRCHFCGHETREKPKCKKCGSERFVKFGYGTQKIEQEIAQMFPAARIMRMDADAINHDKDAYFAKLNAFRNHEADILIGTSMITKGHDFPNVTFVGVLLADGALRIDDYRASERTFSMITQVIGRAGRSSKKGLALIHALNPDSDAIKCACEQDYHKFYVREIAIRERLNFPPFCDVALIEFTSESESVLREYAEKYAHMIKRLASEEFPDLPLIMYGPIEPHVYRAEGKYRLRLVLKCKINPRLRSMIDILLTEHSSCSYPSKPTMAVNFSPSSI